MIGAGRGRWRWAGRAGDAAPVGSSECEAALERRRSTLSFVWDHVLVCSRRRFSPLSAVSEASQSDALQTAVLWIGVGVGAVRVNCRVSARRASEVGEGVGDGAAKRRGAPAKLKGERVEVPEVDGGRGRGEGGRKHKATSRRERCDWIGEMARRELKMWRGGQ